MDLLKKGTVLAFALSAVAAPALAADDDTSFTEVDRNGDGFVDAIEAQDLDLDVSRYDTNDDGVIERAEWQGPLERAGDADVVDRPGADTRESGARPAADVAGLSFEDADLDGSGFIDGPEAQELDLDVVQYDINHNGIIDRVEWERAPGRATEPERGRENR